jgi:hypothetical protein
MILKASDGELGGGHNRGGLRLGDRGGNKESPASNDGRNENSSYRSPSRHKLAFRRRFICVFSKRPVLGDGSLASPTFEAEDKPIRCTQSSHYGFSVMNVTSTAPMAPSNPVVWPSNHAALASVSIAKRLHGRRLRRATFTNCTEKRDKHGYTQREAGQTPSFRVGPCGRRRPALFSTHEGLGGPDAPASNHPWVFTAEDLARTRAAGSGAPCGHQGAGSN